VTERRPKRSAAWLHRCRAKPVIQLKRPRCLFKMRAPSAPSYFVVSFWWFFSSPCDTEVDQIRRRGSGDTPEAFTVWCSESKCFGVYVQPRDVAACEAFSALPSLQKRLKLAPSAISSVSKPQRRIRAEYRREVFRRLSQATFCTRRTWLSSLPQRHLVETNKSDSDRTIQADLFPYLAIDIQQFRTCVLERTDGFRMLSSGRTLRHSYDIL
jgi:hypothetical protein